MRRLLVVALVLAVIAFAIGVAASRGGEPAAAITPTPTATSTPLPAGTFVLTNVSGAAADSVQVENGTTALAEELAYGLSVVSSPAGCSAAAALF